MNPLVDHNRRAWDARARRGERFAMPADAEQFRDPLAALDSNGWLTGEVAGRDVLCLGAGGGKQSALFATAGARVTVVDLSAEMLALDREVAAERGLNIRAVQASMDDLGALPAAGFDMVWQPVSTCYVPDVTAVYEHVARLLRDGGLYVSQHKQPTSLQGELQPTPAGLLLTEPYYREGPLPDSPPGLHREAGTHEFLHRWQDLLGGMCRAGLVIEDLVEPFHADPAAPHDSFAYRSWYVAPYVRVKARRRPRSGAGTARLIVASS
ncbi:MAG: class I SAM-dependent methyltransferase [Pirellulales bacterium]|nr:class I SAM-dependent methyltransferase [Pirellulales bacterium]